MIICKNCRREGEDRLAGICNDCVAKMFSAGSISVNTLSGLLNVQATTLKSYDAKGLLPAIRNTHNSRRYTLEAVDNYIASRGDDYQRYLGQVNKQNSDVAYEITRTVDRIELDKSHDANLVGGAIAPRVYNIKLHHTVDDYMLDGLIHRNLIPAFDMFDDVSLADADSDALLAGSEVNQLPVDLFDKVENSIDVLNDLLGIDWLVLYRESRDELFVAQVNGYEYIRYQALLHVKHYIKITDCHFSMPYVEIPVEIKDEIENSDNLAKLSRDILSFVKTHVPKSLVSAHTNVQKTTIVPNIKKESYDNQIITPNSITNINRQKDDIVDYRRLHVSIFAMHDYLRDNLIEIQEIHSSDADVTFKGEWHDGTGVIIHAFNLTDDRDHTAWLMKLLVQ